MRIAGADGASFAVSDRQEPEGPLILFYTKFFSDSVDIDALKGSYPGRWTLDRRRIAEADAVVFHIPNRREIGDARKYPGQLWVAWCMESRENYPLTANPAFMKHFDLTMTYETGADVWMPYLPDRQWWREAAEREVLPKTEQAPLALFQSSNVNRSDREGFIAELARHIGVDSYGRFMNNRTIEGPDLGRATKAAIIGTYRFSLAMENSVMPDYVTEKMFGPLGAGSVPVYLGAPNAADFAPEHSFIDATAHGGPKGLADYLHHLMETPEEYAAYFAWRAKPLPVRLAAYLRTLETSSYCRLMELVARRMKQRGPRPSGRPSLPFGAQSFVKTRLRRWRREGSLY